MRLAGGEERIEHLLERGVGEGAGEVRQWLLDVAEGLQDLLALHEKKSYTPKYPQARKLHEEDALLVKSTLDRYRKYENDAHEEAILLLTSRIKEVLNIESYEGEHTKFLQTVLQDYIILSR